MRKYIPFNIHRYFLTASINHLVKQGKSVYQIASVLKVHEVLVKKIIFTNELLEQLQINNRRFINDLLFDNPNGFSLYKSARKNHINYSQKEHSFRFNGSYSKTFDGWANKNKRKDELYKKLTTVSSSVFDHFGEALPLDKALAIISAYFNGKSPQAIMQEHNYNQWQLQQVMHENNMESEPLQQVVLARIKNALSAGASHDFIKANFKKISADEMKALQQQKIIADKINRLPNYQMRKQRTRSGRQSKATPEKETNGIAEPTQMPPLFFARQ